MLLPIINISRSQVFRKVAVCAMCTSSFLNSNNSPLKKLLDESASFVNADKKNGLDQDEWATTPYLQDSKIRKQGDYYRQVATDRVDNQEMSIILFPGEGSQYVGMGKGLLKFPIARDLFELANYILRCDLQKICTHGPKDVLNSPVYMHLSIMVTSLAAIERLKEERPRAIDYCAGAAGFGIGEITALVFAGALSFETALRLVKLRAEAIELATKEYGGGMAKVFYGPQTKLSQACEKAKEWAKDRGDLIPECMVSEYLYPHCKMISASSSALDYLEQFGCSKFNIKQIKRVPNMGPLYSPIMQPAMECFQKMLKSCKVEEPCIKVHSTIDGKGYRNALHVRKQLPKQIIKPIKWEQVLHVIYERDQNVHFPRTFECGPGKRLFNLLAHVNAKASLQCKNIEA